jgi:hypothetical protein
MHHWNWASKASGRPADLSAVERKRRLLEQKRNVESARLAEAFGQLPSSARGEPVSLLEDTLKTIVANLDTMGQSFRIFGPNTDDGEPRDWVSLCGRTLSRLALPSPIRVLAVEYVANLLPEENEPARRRLWAAAGLPSFPCLSLRDFASIDARPGALCALVARLARDVRLLALSDDGESVRLHFSQARAAASTLRSHPYLNAVDRQLAATLRDARGQDLEEVVSVAERATLAALSRQQGPWGALEASLRRLVNLQLGLESIETWQDWWQRVEKRLSPEAYLRAELDALVQRVERETRRLTGQLGTDPAVAKQRATRRLRNHVHKLNRRAELTSEIPTDDESIDLLLEVLQESIPNIAANRALDSFHEFAQHRALAREIATHRVAAFESEKPRLRASAHSELTIWEELYRDVHTTEHQRARLRLLWREMAAYLHERERKPPAFGKDGADLFALARQIIDALQTEPEFSAFHGWLAEVRRVFERPGPALAEDGVQRDRSDEQTMLGTGVPVSSRPASGRHENESPASDEDGSPAPSDGEDTGEPVSAQSSRKEKRTISASLWRALPWNWWPSRREGPTGGRRHAETRVKSD